MGWWYLDVEISTNCQVHDIVDTLGSRHREQFIVEVIDDIVNNWQKHRENRAFRTLSREVFTMS